jgi:AcrR family transcriptional regulator
MATQTERREGTKAKILAAARACFAADGYEGASLDAIMTRAGVSKGALYHHFANKLAIMAALYEHAAADAVREGQAAAMAPDLREGPALVRIVAAGLGWLKAVQDPDVGSLVLDIGPRVLGWTWAREIEERYSAGPTRASPAAMVRAVVKGVAGA